jgi:glutamyl/glutaminyl-tRNA synthetase
MYTYAHPIEDALENITHSICTLEFEDQRPFYDWLLETWPTWACWHGRCHGSMSSAA